MPSTPLLPVSGPQDAFDARVETAAFALLREGKNPTVAGIRARLGGASPNKVAPALRRWRVAFAAHLQEGSGAAQDTLPAGILEIVEALWSRALFEAHRVRAEARSTSEVLEQLQGAIEALNVRLAAVRVREVELDAQRQELDAMRRALFEERRRLAALEEKVARAVSPRRKTVRPRPTKKAAARGRPAPRRRRASESARRR